MPWPQIVSWCNDGRRREWAGVAHPPTTSEYVYFEHISDEMNALQAMHAEWKALRKSDMELSNSGEKPL